MLSTTLTKLSIVGAQYYAYHGVKEEERILGGRYEVDLDLWYDATTAIINDDVKDAVNYEEALFCISEVLNGSENFNLVETICNEILNMVMDKFQYLVKASVRIRKTAVPARRILSHVEAEQTIERDFDSESDD